MKYRLTVVALLAALCVSLYFVNSNSYAASAPAWEYKLEDKCYEEKRINTLGADGWELAGVATNNYGGVHCIFKRAK